MSRRMLAEIARRRSRNSKFESRVFVMSRSGFSRSLSFCSSGFPLGNSWGLKELNTWPGISEELMTKPPKVQCRNCCTCQLHWRRRTAALHGVACKALRLSATKHSSTSVLTVDYVLLRPDPSPRRSDDCPTLDTLDLM